MKIKRAKILILLLCVCKKIDFDSNKLPFDQKAKISSFCKSLLCNK